MNIALLFLILLTTMVIFMNRVSTTDVQISANEKAQAIAFYAADAGAYGSAKFVGKAMDRADMPTFNGPGRDFPEVNYIVDDFHDQVAGYVETADDPADDFGFGEIVDEDIEFFLNGYEVNVDVSRKGARNLEGGGAAFGEGSMGVGTGSTGGIAVYFAARSVAEGPKNSRAEVNVEYRKIPGTAGGL